MVYVKPENALKRAEELLAVSQPLEALSMLHDVLLNKRSKSSPFAVVEAVAIKFVELCVELRKGRIAKEGLYSYKNITVHSSVVSIEKVFTLFIDGAESKLKEAQATALGKLGAEADATVEIEDLETPETPESILLSTVSGDDAKDRTDREVVMPWLKFLWEVYRTSLDILKNNNRLEPFYQTIAQRAFAFCRQSSRKTEFRRLADTLRIHLSSISKSSNQQNSISLSDPEVLQRYLDTRFVQLTTATELELWQEGFKSIEDVYQLLILAGSLIVPNTSMNQPMAGLLPAAIFQHKKHGNKMMNMLASYFEKLTEIFAVGGDGLFLAASWNRYFAWIRSMKNFASMSEEEVARISSNVLLSALSVPVMDTTPTTNVPTSTTLSELVSSPTSASPLDLNLIGKSYNNQTKLTILLGLTQVPTRNMLIKESTSKSVLHYVPEEVKNLFEILEKDFHPLSATKTLGPILKELENNPVWSKYAPKIKNVIIAKVLKEVSEFYTTISIETLLNLVSFSEDETTLSTLEKFIVQSNKRSHVHIRINHASRTFEFEADPFVSPSSHKREGIARPSIKSSPLDKFKYTLSSLAKKLYAVTNEIDPTQKENAINKRKAIFQQARQSMEEEHQASLARKSIIERKKELIETIQLRKEKEEAREKALKAQQEAEQSKIKFAEERKRREMERIQRERDEIAREEAKKIAESLKEKTGVIIKEEDLQNLDTRALMSLQIEQIEKGKAEQSARLAATAKKIDYLERAYRKEEIPLLERDFEKQKKRDRHNHVEARKRAVADAKRKHEESLVIKTRLAKVMNDYEEYKSKVEELKKNEVEEREREAEEKIRKEKRKRRETVRKALHERRERIRREEEERIREEEDQARREEEERIQREAEEERQRKEEEQRIRRREEAEERRRQLDEEVARKLAREEEAERKVREREREPRFMDSRPTGSGVGPGRTGAYRPPGARSSNPTGLWRNSGQSSRSSEPNAPRSFNQGPPRSQFDRNPRMDRPERQDRPAPTKSFENWRKTDSSSSLPNKKNEEGDGNGGFTTVKYKK